MAVKFFVHHEKDTVGVAVADIKAGETATGWVMDTDNEITVTAINDIPLGHKIALCDISAGDTVIKYGESIGKTTQAVKKGEHVHIHNLKTARW
ncbi:UxaA family hydrolase [Desulfofundulus thermosubterraneus]|uniref:(2R)-sulfolactate sulfo-lyase subunit alpha n=1 Tax=Desulfofundulus thermosubterraneus DSM 16057 TaxID=1121432 RepID=A0A1M6CVQ7_9FIRM|nr:UxaA family hydrolase [Desulfofundulus thermosubterraneus]SHI65097.1 (2R)-sulfolactate sulfo-lyase subunit alpha [Desulfofundulus thermosubterraneus DSM 16057]